MDQFAMLLDHDADPCIGLDKNGRNILHLLASRCTVNVDLRTFLKIIIKKVEVIQGWCGACRSLRSLYSNL